MLSKRSEKKRWVFYLFFVDLPLLSSLTEELISFWWSVQWCSTAPIQQPFYWQFSAYQKCGSYISNEKICEKWGAQPLQEYSVHWSTLIWHYIWFCTTFSAIFFIRSRFKLNIKFISLTARSLVIQNMTLKLVTVFPHF